MEGRGRKRESIGQHQRVTRTGSPGWKYRPPILDIRQVRGTSAVYYALMHEQICKCVIIMYNVYTELPNECLEMLEDVDREVVRNFIALWVAGGGLLLWKPARIPLF